MVAAASSALEESLWTLTGVLSVRVTQPDAGTVDTSILVTPERDPRAIVREVARLVDEVFGDDRPKVTVQVLSLDAARDAVVVDLDDLDAAGDEQDAQGGRLAYRGLRAVTEGPVFTAEVALTGTSDLVGQASGSAASSAVPRLVAEATLKALCDEANLVDCYVEDAAVVDLGRRQLAIVALVLPGAEGEDVLVGSAAVRNTGPLDAVARAVLAATNRRVSRRAEANTG